LGKIYCILKWGHIPFLAQALKENRNDYEKRGVSLFKYLKEPYRGIHSVFSGFNDAFRKHFNKDPIEFTSRMVSEGKIEIVPLRSGKGVMLYLPGKGPRGKKVDEALKKILG
jgi:hypothetical protein